MKWDPVEVNVMGGLNCAFPKMARVRQLFDSPTLLDVDEHIKQQLVDNCQVSVLGKRIAITVGSRGIAKLVPIIRSLVHSVQAAGGDPFIVPSMGSHGGATAEGQVEVLKSYGITEDSVGAKIYSSMDVVHVGSLADGTPIFTDKFAYEADGIIVVNKVKPHADFKAHYESGLVKMLAIGLGKHKGAVTLHRHGFDRFFDVLPAAAEILINNLSIVCGVAILENAEDELMDIEIISSENILSREKELLKLAKNSIGRILIPEIDVLIIENIGKDISGEGMDPNVTGRPGSGLPGFEEAPSIQKIVVLNVTPKSNGNGVGIGLADVTTMQCIEKIDLGMVYTNALTATILNPAKLPVVMNNDHDAICISLKTCNRTTPENAKIVRIKNTLELSIIEVSESLRGVVDGNENLHFEGFFHDLKFNEKCLVDVF